MRYRIPVIVHFYLQSLEMYELCTNPPTDSILNKSRQVVCNLGYF